MNKFYIGIILVLALTGLYLQFFTDCKMPDAEVMSQYEQMR